MVGWEHAHTQVDVLAGDVDLDPAVLRSALLGDVDLPHDLQAAHDRAEQPSGGALDLLTDAVDPVSDPDPVGEGLDVDVRGPHLHRFFENQVH